MAPKFPVQSTRNPRPHPPDSELKFGRVFTDHMFLLDYEEGAGWKNPRFAPFGDLSISPAAAGVHYGQALFDGLKAFRGERRQDPHLPARPPRRPHGRPAPSGCACRRSTSS